MPIALVTGATDGIGLETARGLLQRGWRVLVHGRSQARAGQALAALKGAGGEAVPVWGDLASLDQVLELARQSTQAAPALDVLLANAGVYEQARSLTADGFERTLGVNHFAHLLLALRLATALKAAAAPRVVWVSSQVHVGASLDLDDLDLTRRWSGYGAYGASKLANAATAAEMARQPAWRGVISVSLHPGVVATKLLHRNFGPGGVPTQDGARTSVFCATAQGLAAHNGGYFKDSAPARPNPKVEEPAFTAALWTASLRRLDKWLK